jgi:putative ABC transport system permease protein
MEGSYEVSGKWSALQIVWIKFENMKYIFKTILRNFTRRPLTNLINLFGLAISFTLVIILSVYCYSELTTDQFHKNGKRVYMYRRSDKEIYSPGILKETIDKNVPGVESTIRITGTWEAPVFQAENKEPVISDLMFADEDFFKFFTYRVVQGDAESALKEPLTIVITETLAKKLFGTENALGKIIKLNNSSELSIRAIISEPNANSCLSFSAIASMSTQKIVQGQEGEYTDWGWMDFQTFLLLNKETNHKETEKTILSIVPEDFKNNYENAKLVPLEDIYFSKFMLYGNDYLVFGDKNKVLLLVLSAALVLIIALVNFINITSSQWLGRIKQTGIMKILGAKQSSILLNLLSESFIFFLAALLIAIYLANSANLFIMEYTGIHFSRELTYSPGFVLISLVSILFLSLIFSIIQALRISSSKAIDNLNNTINSGKINFSFNTILVTIQFVIAIVLIAFTTLVQKQVRFGSNNLGFNQENIIGVKLTPQLNQKKDVLKKLLLERPSIHEISFTTYYPGKVISQWGVEMEIDGENKQLDFDTFNADATFLKIMGLQLASGRFFSDDLATDKEKILVNETFCRKYNLTNPLSKGFTMGKRTYEIVGVVKDSHFKPVSQPINPMVIRNEQNASHCLVKLQTASFSSLSEVIREIKATASELSPSFPVEVSFFNQAVENMYESELRFRRTFSLFAGCAMVICCLGILAMSLFACQKRIKEIGIRKINGAKVLEIMLMLNKDVIKLVALAFLIATPTSWYVMHKWLLNYAYRTELSWWIFVLSGLLALVIALLTVSWQSWRAASRNPVEALRYE